MAQGKSQMAVWNKELTNREKADKAVKNLIKAEEELKVLATYLKVDLAKLMELKEKQSYNTYAEQCTKKALKEFGLDAGEQMAKANTDLDFIAD